MELNAKEQMATGLIAAVVLVGLMVVKGPSQSPLLRPGSSPATPLLAAGTVAPALRLPTVNADSVRLEQLRGGESVLVFVSPMCPYCGKLKAELLGRGLPDLDGRLVFVTDSVADGTVAEHILDLESRIAAVYPVAVDRAGAAFEAYQVRPVPTTYVIDTEGLVAASAIGVEGGLALIDGFVERRTQPQ